MRHLAAAHRRHPWLHLALVMLLGACSSGDDPLAPPSDPADAGPDAPDPTVPIQLNNNGGWCWYQDERVVFDATSGKLLAGTLATSEGAEGETRGGALEIASYDVATGAVQRVELGRMGEDDHASPALLIRPDGRYLAVYTNHGSDLLTQYRVSTHPHDPSAWDDRQLFDWATVGSDFNVTYSNLFYLSAEARLYNFARADGRSPNALISTDQGSTWSHLGKLTSTGNVGYVNGYFKYASLGVDRIDFVATEHHPRDYNTSIYHGYLEGGTVCLSDGTVLDSEAFVDPAPEPQDLTTVFAAGSQFDGETMTRAWPCDLHVDVHGLPYVVFSARANDNLEHTNYEDHRFFYARYDGATWHLHQLAKAGPLLFEREQDYTGLAALVPGDPDRLYISTPIDPRSDAPTEHHEIYAGATSDGGATWTWTPVTTDSSADNLRPVVPIAPGSFEPLLWLRGTMPSFWDYRFEVLMLPSPR